MAYLEVIFPKPLESHLIQTVKHFFSCQVHLPSKHFLPKVSFWRIIRCNQHEKVARKAKMKVLGLNRKYLILLGVCSTSNAGHQAMFKFVLIVVLVLQILGFVAGVWFIATFLKSDLNGVLYAGFHTSAYSTSMYSLVVGFVHQDEIVGTFQTLQHIYDECERNRGFFRFISSYVIIKYSFVSRSHPRYIEHFIGRQ